MASYEPPQALTGPRSTRDGHHPWPLSSGQSAWLVLEGDVAVFSIEHAAGAVEGRRRFMYSAGPGALLLSASQAPGAAHTLVAVPLGQAELIEVSLERLVTLTAAGDAEVAALLTAYVSAIGAPFAASRAVPSGAGRPSVAPAALAPGDVWAAFHEPTWLRLASGQARWLGLEVAPISGGGGVLALPTGTWLQAVDGLALSAAPLDTLSPDELRQGLAGLHDLAFAALGALKDQDEAAHQARYRDRADRDQRTLSEVVEGLAALTGTRRAPEETAADPLLAAAMAVGRALGVTVRPAAASEDPSRLKDPVEAIARASRVRTRQVLLAPPWWRRDGGPLLGYMSEDRRPVALLPEKGRYTLVDPTRGTRETVDEAMAERLEPFATMLYRSLPAKADTAFTVFRFATQGREKEMIYMAVLGVVGSLLGMLAPQMMGNLIDQAIPNSDRGLLVTMGAALFMSAFGVAIFQFCQGIMAQRIEGQADATVQAAVWDRVLNIHAPFFRQHTVGDLTERVMAISHIREQLSGATLRTLLSSTFALLNLGLMFTYSTPLALVACVLTAVTVVVTTGHSYLMRQRLPAMQALGGQLASLVLQLLGGVAKLRSSAAEGRAFAFWARQFRQQVKLQREVDNIQHSLAVFNQVMSPISTMVIFWCAASVAGVAAAGHGGISTGVFLAFNVAFGTFMGGMLELSGTLVGLLDIQTMWNRAKPVLVAETESDEGRHDPGRLSGRLAVERVTFRYEAGGRTILEDISLFAEPGEHIAFVGASGCGKSTLFRLLLGFERPEGGMVSFDGQDMAKLDLRAVRRQLGVVLQNGKLNAGSVFENIACGALITQQDAWDAAECAGFGDDLRAMPMGMHTIVAEGGQNLSGGQRQRLLIARAFALKPRIILFDEATSALDNTTQATVSESLERLKVTRVSIAHRLSTIRQADRIYVFDQGRIAQVGTFDELSRAEGLFATLVARQMA